jgi:hypothetical protein
MDTLISNTLSGLSYDLVFFWLFSGLTSLIAFIIAIEIPLQNPLGGFQNSFLKANKKFPWILKVLLFFSFLLPSLLFLSHTFLGFTTVMGADWDWSTDFIGHLPALYWGLSFFLSATIFLVSSIVSYKVVRQF